MAELVNYAESPVGAESVAEVDRVQAARLVVLEGLGPAHDVPVFGVVREFFFIIAGVAVNLTVEGGHGAEGLLDALGCVVRVSLVWSRTVVDGVESEVKVLSV